MGHHSATAHEAEWGTRSIQLPDDLWERLSAAPVLLEIGCGTGHLLNLLQQRCRGRLIGMDADLALLRLAHEQYPGLTLYGADAQTALALRDGSVDVAVSSDVIEHLPDPPAHLREVRRVLRPGGLYLIKTPNAALDTPYWLCRLTLSRLRAGARFTRAWRETRTQMRQPGQHCSTQAAGSLVRLLKSSGFEVLRMVKQPPSTTQQQKIASQPMPLRGALRGLSALVPLLPYCCQWSLVGVFRKPEEE